MICETFYKIGANNKVYGDTKGVCKITGKDSKGIEFKKWVSSNFTDHAYLKPGNIISNEALFCFDEQSEIVQQKTGKEKLQKMRTYSHIICKNRWYCLTKADKKLIFELITKGAEIVCLTETGQKHIIFKHRDGYWQLDELFVKPDVPILKLLHENIGKLIGLGFSQTEITTGNYKAHRIFKAGADNWKKIEDIIYCYRGTGIFDFTSYMLYEYTEEITAKLEIKSSNVYPSQLSLF